MAKAFPFLLFCILGLNSSAQVGGDYVNHRLPQLSLSFNPIGVVFFGPNLDLKYSLNELNTLDLQFRSTTFGALSKKVKGGEMDRFNGTAIGMGFSRFNASAMGLFYGGMIQVGKMHTVWDEGEDWEWYEDANNYVLAGHLAYRMNLRAPFFADLGVYAGAVYTDSFWDYDDESYGVFDEEPRNSTTLYPIGMLEASIGIRLINKKN